MDGSGARWDPPRRDPAPAAAPTGWKGLLHAARRHPAWWIVPALLTWALLGALVLLARGDLVVPELYRLF